MPSEFVVDPADLPGPVVSRPSWVKEAGFSFLGNWVGPLYARRIGWTHVGDTEPGTWHHPEKFIAAANLRRVYHAEGRPEKFGRPLPAHTSLWFDLESPPAVNGDNTLGVTLVTTRDGPADVVIEEVEVVVMPKPIGAP
jgi:hypothetical protein